MLYSDKPSRKKQEKVVKRLTRRQKKQQADFLRIWVTSPSYKLDTIQRVKRLLGSPSSIKDIHRNDYSFINIMRSLIDSYERRGTPLSKMMFTKVQAQQVELICLKQRKLTPIPESQNSSRVADREPDSHLGKNMSGVSEASIETGQSRLAGQ